MRDLHRLAGWVLIGSNAAAGLWCLAAFRWRRAERRAMWALVIASQAMAFVQAVIGAALSRQAGVQLGDMHALYGFSAIVAAMILYGYRTSPFVRGKELLLYGCGCLFIMGLGLRNLFLH
jgi:uncharacterized membrane protein